MPFRVSGVPPLLLVTMQSVSESSPLSVSSVRAMPSGSVLSMKWMRMRSEEGLLSASLTNMGPSAEPPMPIASTCVNREAMGGRIFPACTSAANFLMDVVSDNSPAISFVGESCGARSQ